MVHLYQFLIPPAKYSSLRLHEIPRMKLKKKKKVK